jgi:hypothetical protein
MEITRLLNKWLIFLILKQNTEIKLINDAHSKSVYVQIKQKTDKNKLEREKEGKKKKKKRTYNWQIIWT